MLALRAVSLAGMDHTQHALVGLLCRLGGFESSVFFFNFYHQFPSACSKKMSTFQNTSLAQSLTLQQHHVCCEYEELVLDCAPLKAIASHLWGPEILSKQPLRSHTGTTKAFTVAYSRTSAIYSQLSQTGPCAEPSLRPSHSSPCTPFPTDSGLHDLPHGAYLSEMPS